MCEIFICADEVTAAEKTARRRERRGMRRLQNEVMAGINQRAFGLCIRAPQHEDKLFTAGGKALNQRIGALLPAAFGMLPGRLRSTVSTALSSSTPWHAQPSRQPYEQERIAGALKSAAISLKIFLNEGGGRTPGGTENANPCACGMP